MVYRVVVGVFVVALSCVFLGGCQTARQISSTASSFETLANEAADLARTSANVVQRVDQTLASMEEHVVATAKELPKIAKSTNTVLEDFDESLRSLSAASEKAIRTSNETLERLSPKAEALLVRVDTVAGTADKALSTLSDSSRKNAETLKTIGDSVQGTLGEIELLAKDLRPQIGSFQEKVGDAAVRTADAVTKFQTSLSNALAGIDKGLGEIETEIARSRDAEGADRRKRLYASVEKFVSALSWFLGAMSLLTIATFALFVHHKLTARSRHRRLAHALGLLEGDGP